MRIAKYLVIAAAIVITMAMAADCQAGVSVTPERHIIALKPGEEGIAEYIVHNSGEYDIFVKLDPQCWQDRNVNPYSFLSFEEPRFTVKAGESKPLRVKFKIPEDRPGETIIMIFLSYKQNPDSILNIRNGIPLYLVASGTEKYDFNIGSISVDYGKMPNPTDLSMVIKTQNKGNIHIIPDLKASLIDSKGYEMKKFSMVRSKTLLSGQAHNYRFIWRSAMIPEGDYKLVISFAYEDKVNVTKTFDLKVANSRISVIKDYVDQPKAAETAAQDTTVPAAAKAQ